MRHSLTVRLLGLTIGAMLLTEIVLFIPGVTQSRRAWLNQHLRRAEIAGQAAAEVPVGLLDDRMRDDLLRLADARMIRMIRPTRTVVDLAPMPAIVPASEVDMRHETYVTGLLRALSALVFRRDRPLQITAVAPLQRSILLVEIVEERGLSQTLRAYFRRIVGLWLAAILVTSLLLYLALLVLLVRPMRRLTHSIALFRRDPDHIAIAADGGSTGDSMGGSGGEMAMAERELVAMQIELRNALWHNARLAALGATLARVSHDMRGILSTALLTADRLTMHSDPAVARAGQVLVDSVDRAAQLVRQTLDFARDAPPPPERTRFSLHGLITEAAPTISERPLPALDLAIDPGLMVEADRGALLRVMANLIRNAGEAGARRIRITAAHLPPNLSIMVEDDGPGLPEHVQAHLFRPFVSSLRPGGTGLGLAIVRDLMRGQGGDARLHQTGSSGTIFQLLLPWREG